MNKLTKFVLGTLLGVMVFGMTTFASEFSVTPASAVFYTNSNTIVLMDASADAQVVLPSCESGLPLQVTGITSNGYWQINLGGQTYYVAGIGLSQSPTAETVTASAPTQTSTPTSTGKYTCVIETGDEKLFESKTCGNWGVSNVRKDWTNDPNYIYLRDQLETAYAQGKDGYTATLSVANKDMSHIIKNLCVDFMKAHPEVRMGCGAKCPTASFKNPFMGHEYAEHYIIYYIP